MSAPTTTTHPSVARAQEAHDRWVSANAALRQAPSDESLIAERDAAWSAYRTCFVECDDIEVRCDHCGIPASWCDIEHVGEPCAECRQRKPRQLAIGQRHIVGDLRIAARDVSAPTTTVAHTIAAMIRTEGNRVTVKCTCGSWGCTEADAAIATETHEGHVRAVKWRTDMGDGIVEWVPQTDNGPREHVEVLRELVENLIDGPGTPCLLNNLCGSIGAFLEDVTTERRLYCLLLRCDPGEENIDFPIIRPTHVDDFLDHGTDPEHLTDAQIDALFWLDRLAGERREDHLGDARKMLAAKGGPI